MPLPICRVSASVRLAYSNPKPPVRTPATRSLSGAQARTSVSGAGLGGQDAASATSNNSAGRRIPQPPHAESARALAGVLVPFTHAAQQTGPSEPFRQGIRPCCVWSFTCCYAASAPGQAAHEMPYGLPVRPRDPASSRPDSSRAPRQSRWRGPSPSGW